MRNHASIRTKPLRFETLETRQMLAVGISAVLENGLLTIDGSDASETIHVWRKAGEYRIDGVADTFAGRNVRSIKVNCGDGDDLVRLDTGSIRGQQPLNRTVAVHSGAGSDTITWAQQTVYVSGTGNTLVVDPDGRAKLNGKLPDWFDTHVADAALRELAKEDYVEQGQLSRGAMHDIFNQVAGDGTVSNTEYAGLKAIVQHTQLFENVAYVQNLSSKVVLANPANRNYQGAPLGNLAAGATADHLEKLVDKWFLGTDHPLAQSSDQSTTYVYAEATGPLFSPAPQYADVRQGYLGDCYFLSAVAEVALRTPGVLRSAFIINGDQTYTVRFYRDGRADYVTVDSELPVDSQGECVFANQGIPVNDPNQPTWVALLEKAYAQLNEEGWIRKGEQGSGINSYQALANGFFEKAARQLTPKRSAYTIYPANQRSFQSFLAAANAGRYLGFSTKTNPPNPLLVSNHSYAFLSYDRATRRVTLFNPWGLKNGTANPGLVRLTWAQIRANFSDIDCVG
mgnify:CR=1 FL=1